MADDNLMSQDEIERLLSQPRRGRSRHATPPSAGRRVISDIESLLASPTGKLSSGPAHATPLASAPATALTGRGRTAGPGRYRETSQPNDGETVRSPGRARRSPTPGPGSFHARGRRDCLRRHRVAAQSGRAGFAIDRRSGRRPRRRALLQFRFEEFRGAPAVDRERHARPDPRRGAGHEDRVGPDAHVFGRRAAAPQGFGRAAGQAGGRPRRHLTSTVA